LDEVHPPVTVGELVGDPVGAFVVGDPVGADVVGEPVGAGVVGESVGASVVGDPVGAFVEPVVGEPVGASVGIGKTLSKYSMELISSTKAVQSLSSNTLH
jgi:hypothetical protein